MKQKWEYKKLTDVCSILYGYPFDSSNFSTEAKGMPLIRIRDVKPGFSETYYLGSYPQEYIVHKGNFLIGMDGEFNIAPWKSEDALLNQRVCKITSKGDIAIEYVYRFLLKELKQIEDETPFVTVKHLSAKRLNLVVLPVPPLAEQQRIVAELDLLTGIIDKQKAQLMELDTLAQSIFYDMFGDPIENEKGWNVKKLGDVCSLITDGVHAKPVYVQEGIPFISVKDITTGKLVFDDVKYVSVSDHVTMSKRCPVAKGDILYTKVGATYGRPALVDTDREFSLYVSVALLKPKQDLVNNVFLCHQMATDFVKHQADKSIKGIGVPDLHLNMIRNFHILIPPKSLQLVFNSKIASIEKQKSAIKASIADTQKLLDYTMDKYFG